MKPIRLKIKGLNSFIEEQTIDFETLTDRGLFGIFGATGSGKSTILDGITLALYGEVARKSENFINTNCKTASVVFDFQISGKNIKKYRVSRDFKTFEETGKPRSNGAKLLDITEADVIVLADKKTQVDNKIKEIIGLDSVDFTRTVVLPQGKFSEFLSLEGKPRREMLERLFNLQEYGDVLSSRLSKRIGEVKTKESVLEGKLSGYEDVSEEKLKEEKEGLETLIEEIKELKIEKLRVDKLYDEGEKLHLLLKEYSEYKKEEALLEEKKYEIEEYKKRGERGESALKVNPYLKAFLDTNEEIVKVVEERGKSEATLKSIKNEKEEIDKEIIKVKRERDLRIPELKVREQGIKDGILLEEEIKKIFSEVKSEEVLLRNLREAYKNNKGKRDELTVSINMLKDEVSKKEDRVEVLKIDEEIKSLVQKGLVQEEKYISIKRQYLLASKRKDENRLSVENDLKDVAVLEEEYTKIKKELEECRRKLTHEEENSPGNETELLNLNNSLNEAKEKWKSFNKLNEEKEKINSSLKEDSKKEIALSKNVEKLNINIDLLKERIKTQKEQNIATSLRENLKSGEACPVCGSKEHFIEKLHVDTNDEIKALENELILKEEHLRENNNELLVTRERINIGNERIEKLIEDINLLGEGFKELDLISLEENLSALKGKIESYSKRKKELSEEKETLNEKYLSLSSKLKAKEGKLLEGEKNLKLLSEEEESLKTSLEKEEDILNDLKNLAKVEDFEIKAKEIKEKEREGEILLKEIKSIRVKIDENEKLERLKTEELNLLGEEGKAKKGSLDEKIKNLDEKKKIINDRFGEKNLESLLGEVQKEIDKIEMTYSILEEKKIKVDGEYQRVSDGFIALVTKKEELDKRIEREKVNLSNAMKEEGFLSSEEVVKCLISKEAIENLKITIREYSEKVSKVKGAIDSLAKKIDGRNITEEEFITLKDEKIKKEEKLGEKEKVRVRIEENIIRISKKLEELNELIKEKDDVSKKLALLKDLDGLLKGKKFVEYMAISQLKYISLEASKKLKDITGGIYGLEVDKDGKFLIRDYKNGGVERDASTLSGGETFLASLCLALALSSQIQLKGTAPLELFFLDEGFGTLDENLLEIVMGSLEKIHNDKLKVGIISHVESIKNRMPVKLIVTPAESGKGGTKVKIERS